MSTDPDKHEPADSRDEEEQDPDRPTLAPPFDPVEFAREFSRPSPARGTQAASESGGIPVDPKAPDLRPLMRQLAPTHTDPAELEDARRLSASSDAPAAAAALSLANSRVPSNAPPRLESTNAFTPIDKTWVELEIATRPPPPMPPGEGDEEAFRVDLPKHSEPPVTKRGDSLAQVQAVDPPPTTPQEMHDRLSLGDYSGALAIAERLLELDPDDDEVLGCAEQCRTVLRQMYTTRIGPLDRVPMVMVARDQLRWLSIDHRAGFVLSLIDGVSSLEMILDVSGMPELDALRILCELAQQRIISFR